MSARLFNSRFSLPYLLVAIAVAASLAVAGCGDSEDGVSADEAVSAALTKAATITSGNADLKASVLTGSLPPSFDIVGGGPFDTEAKGGAAYDLDLTIQVAGTDQLVGFAAVDGQSYVKIDDKAAEVDSKASGGLDPASIKGFIDSLDQYVSGAEQVEDRQEGGETLKVYNVDIDVKKLLADAKENNDGIAELSVPGLGTADDLEKSVSDATATIAVAPDGFPRSLSINVPISRGSTEAGVRATLTLTEINESVTIEKPSNVVDRSELGGVAELLGF